LISDDRGESKNSDHLQSKVRQNLAIIYPKRIKNQFGLNPFYGPKDLISGKDLSFFSADDMGLGYKK
jgi:hypothetical protein